MQCGLSLQLSRLLLATSVNNVFKGKKEKERSAEERENGMTYFTGKINRPLT